MTEADRFGLGWRPELAAGILRHLDRIDIVEVVAEPFLPMPRRRIRALRTLAAQVPIQLHGVSLGLASTVPVETRRLDRLARLVEASGAEAWSEHLAFVRAGGIEIGHLAAPPRSIASVDGALANLDRATRIVGAPPLVENVATLVDPPGSALSEPAWISDIVRQSGAGLLLDLHNLHANAINFGCDAAAMLAELPLDRVATVHLSGGRMIRSPAGVQRLLDDHLHDPPDAVFDLLRRLGRLAPQPLTVILERDGRYPPFAELLASLDAARQALAAGRRAALS